MLFSYHIQMQILFLLFKKNIIYLFILIIIF